MENYVGFSLLLRPREDACHSLSAAVVKHSIQKPHRWGGGEFASAYTLRPQFITEGGQDRNHRGPLLAGSTFSSLYSPGPPRDDTAHSALGPPASINKQNSLTQICPQVSLISNSPTQASLSNDSRLCQVDNLIIFVI